MRKSAAAHEVRVAAQAAGLRLLYHISKLALRVPLVLIKKHGIYADAAKRPQQNRACRGFAWFNALKPMRKSASAHEVRAAAQAAGLRLLYHDAAQRPQQNRIHCGFAWFNALKPVRESATAHEVRAAAQAVGLRLLYRIFPCPATKATA